MEDCRRPRVIVLEAKRTQGFVIFDKAGFIFEAVGFRNGYACHNANIFTTKLSEASIVYADAYVGAKYSQIYRIFFATCVAFFADLNHSLVFNVPLSCFVIDGVDDDHRTDLYVF